MADVYDAIAARYANKGAAPAPDAPPAAPGGDAYDAIAARFSPRVAQIPNEFGGRAGPYDATWDMSPTEVSMAVYSRMVRNMGVAAKQRFLEYLSTDGFTHAPQDGIVPWASMLEQSKQEVGQERAISAPLMRAKGAFAGELASGLPLMAFPPARGTGAVVGALSGFLTPLGPGEGPTDLLKNVGLNTGAGVLGEAAGKYLLQPVLNTMGRAWQYATGKTSVGNLPPDMAERAAAIESVPGARPTKAVITRSPEDWTVQAESAKVPGALEAANNWRLANQQALRESFEAMRQGPKSTPQGQGLAVQQGVVDAQTAAKDAVDKVYQMARTAQGNDIPVHPDVFWERVNPVLENFGDVIPDPIKRRLQQFQAGQLAAEGQVPAASGAAPRDLNLGAIADLYQLINARMKSAQGSEKAALGQLRDAIVDAGDQIPASAAPAWSAFKQATDMYRQYKEAFEPAPIDKLATTTPEAMTPETLPQIVTRAGPGDIGSLASMTSSSPDARAALHDSIIDYLVREASDERTGAFSGARLKRAMDAIGPERLAAVLDPGELTRLSQLALASEALTVPPTGTAINTSNTTSAFNRLLQSMGSSSIGGALAGGAIEHALGGLGVTGPAAGMATGAALGAIKEWSARRAAQQMFQPSMEDIAREVLGSQVPPIGQQVGQGIGPAALPLASVLLGTQQQ